VGVCRDDQPLFFARILGKNDFDTHAESIAVYQPRDIMLVLDASASMNDDSQFRAINGPIGQSAVEANMYEIYQDLALPALGSLQWEPQYIESTDDAVVSAALGLDSVSYPYPVGSWPKFFEHIQKDGWVKAAGYRKKYGYKTFMDYLLSERPKYSETPDLWKTPEQPITAVKDAVTVFLAFLQEVETDDKVGLAIYTHPSSGAVLESELTNNMQLIEDVSRERQAGHYDRYTNIGAGIETALDEFEDNARIGAFKLIVLLTDGIANRPVNTTQGIAFALEQAQASAAVGIPIVTVSLGAAADVNLMQQIADDTNGVHFNVPGGQTVAQYEEDLKDVFRSIAGDRPLKLVQ